MINRIYQCCCYLLVGTVLVAQGIVNPGDANHDGMVDHHDILSVGYAFGNFGASRIGSGPGASQAYNQPWVGSFPNGLNFIYADTDGNGQVNVLDLLFVGLNDGTSYSGGLPASLPEGVPGIDAEINLNNGSELDADVISGQTLSIPLRAENLPMDVGINGVALTLTIDTSLVESFSFNLSEDWLLADGVAFPFVRQDGNTIRIAISRLGANPVNQPVGEIGALSIIIIEDLVGLLPATPDEPIEIVSINSIQLVDGDFETLATANRGLNIGALSSVSTTNQIADAIKRIDLIPNPTDGQLAIQSEHDFSRLEIFSLNGQRQVMYEGPQIQQHRLSLENLPAGLYYLRLTDERWSRTLPLIIEWWKFYD